jgi:hypothetical protein
MYSCCSWCESYPQKVPEILADHIGDGIKRPVLQDWKLTIRKTQRLNKSPTSRSPMLIAPRRRLSEELVRSSDANQSLIQPCVTMPLLDCERVTSEQAGQTSPSTLYPCTKLYLLPS